MLVVVLLLAAQLASRLRAQNERGAQCAAGILGACGFDETTADFGLPAPVAVPVDACDGPCPWAAAADEPASARPAATSTRVQLPRSSESQGRESPANADARAGNRHATTTPSTPVSLAGPRASRMSALPPIERARSGWASPGLVPARPLAVNLTTFLEATVYSVAVLDRSQWIDRVSDM